MNDLQQLPMRTLLPPALLSLLLLSCTTASSEPPKPRQDSPGEAEEFAMMKRFGGNSSANVPQLYASAREQVARMRVYSTKQQNFAERGKNASPRLTRWQELGPGNIGGRTRTLVIDSDNPRVMYAGGVSGGIWKTENAGESWRPLEDMMANLAVNSLVMDPRDHRTLYAGTGEGYFREEIRGTGLPLRGAGIFVSRDAGETWTRLESTITPDFHWVNDLVISAHDSQRIYAATRTGVWRSTDAGQTWSRVLETTVRGGCLDLAHRPAAEGDYLFASCGTFERATVYRNQRADGPGQWQSVLSELSMGRTSLAVAPSNPSIIYALSASNAPGPEDHPEQGLYAVFRSDSNGDEGSWNAMFRNTDSDPLARMILTNPIAGLENVCSGGGDRTYVTMGWYVNVIAVDPRDPDRVWAAGVDLFRSDDGGRTWGVASYWWTNPAESSFAHADHHGIYFHPQYDGTTNQTMFSTNDGGVYRTDNARAAVGLGAQAVCDPSRSSVRFAPLNRDFGVTQFYHGVVFPDGEQFMGGAQDNGTLIGSTGSPNGWWMVSGGDGAYSAIDPNNPLTFYVSSQGGAFRRTSDGGQTFLSGRNGLNDAFLFIAPLAIDPNESRRLWTGGRRLWRTDNSMVSWAAASTTLDGRVSAIGVAPGRSDRVVAGTNSGAIYRNDNATTVTGSAVWSSARPRDGFVSSITFDPMRPNVVYATYAGFGGAHVWKSSDGGATWSASDGSGANAIPDIPVHSLVADPTLDGRLYIGTDLGVFVSLDRGATWNVENSGFANVVTEWLTLGRSPEGYSLYAFTHGRGAWRVPLGVSRERTRIRRP
jgi:photosystem II stability/assembly factor-like uncharacterized protein